MMEAYILINEKSNCGEYGFVYVSVPGLQNQSLAIELIEFNTYLMYNNLFHKDVFLKKDVIPMPIEMFKKWEEAFYDHDDGSDLMNQLVEEVISAHKTMEALSQ